MGGRCALMCCMHVSELVCTHPCVYMCTHTLVYTCKASTGYHVSSSIGVYHIDLRRVSHWTRVHHFLGWLARKLSRSTHLCPPNPRVPGTAALPGFVQGCWGLESRLLRLQRKVFKIFLSCIWVFVPLSHHSSPHSLAICQCSSSLDSLCCVWCV